MKVLPWLAVVGVGVVLLGRRVAGATIAPVNGGASADDEAVSLDPGVTTGVLALGMAIAHAEGFFVAGSIPARAHNPGDLKIPGWTGDTLGDGISVFQSDAEGWDRLHRQLQLIQSGDSRVYTADDSLAAVAENWTQTQQSDWLANVLEYLQARDYPWIDEDTPVGDVLA